VDKVKEEISGRWGPYAWRTASPEDASAWSPGGKRAFPYLKCVMEKTLIIRIYPTISLQNIYQYDYNKEQLSSTRYCCPICSTKVHLFKCMCALFIVTDCSIWQVDHHPKNCGSALEDCARQVHSIVIAKRNIPMQYI
jgi:hypothetical protein